jgi:uncharacterized Zn finger protein (UPF0148 family)
MTPASVLFSQTYTTVSKSCGKCGKPVSSSSKIGDICPHCGVRWGYENTTTSTSPSYKKYTLTDFTPDSNKNRSNTQKSTSSTVSKKTKEPNPFSTYSRTQTENWILNKLSSYGNNYTCYSEILGIYSSTSYSDYEFKFQEGYFIVAYLYDNKDDKVTYIPLYDINYIYGKDYDNHFSISTNSQTMYDVNLTTNYKNTSDYLSIGFQNNSETDILKQLENAFLHLKSISSKPTSTQLPNFTPKRITNKPSIAETKAWILQKLNSYRQNIYHPGPSVQTPYGSTDLSSSDKDFTFEFFNDAWLTIKYYKDNQQRTVQIPICEVTISRKNPTFNGSDENLQFYSSYKKIMTGYGNVSDFAIKIDFAREENLEARLLKAFANLKSYCQKVQTKETF